jgi:hypothetical protein|tara:strand:- start:79 stop:396 length:318 start_codon:yes stop_codon:yes gene_type:complete
MTDHNKPNKPSYPAYVNIDGVVHKLVPKSHYDNLQTERIKLQMEYDETQVDVEHNINLCRIISGDNRAPYFGKATETMRYNDVQDPVEFADTFNQNPIVQGGASD